MKSEVSFEDYAINIAPIPEDEGDWYLVTFPDLPRCLADAQTLEEAIAEARDAFNAWVSAEWEDRADHCPRRRPTAASSYNVSPKRFTCGSPSARRARE